MLCLMLKQALSCPWLVLYIKHGKASRGRMTQTLFCHKRPPENDSCPIFPFSRTIATRSHQQQNAHWSHCQLEVTTQHCPSRCRAQTSSVVWPLYEVTHNNLEKGSNRWASRELLANLSSVTLSIVGLCLEVLIIYLFIFNVFGCAWS